MGDIQLRQLAASIRSSVEPHVDLSDVKDADRDIVGLSRGLAAWILMQRCQISPELAAEAVSDGFDDNGIDAAWVDDDGKTIYLVQSKWATKGTGSIAAGDMHKFVHGVRNFVNAEFTKFNGKIQARRQSFEIALEELDVQVALIAVHSGTDPISSQARDAVNALLNDMNDPIETVSFEYLSQKELHALLRSSAQGPKPDVDATLFDWGAVEEPYRAFYGQVSAHEVASWYEEHGTRLLADNIRQFLGDSEVNESITNTLLANPEHFWYLNNGITALCDGFSKKAAQGTSKKSGKFRFSGVSIVNGAQTVGCLAKVNADHPDRVADARVIVRFISLEGCPSGFAQDVTRGTNTQNRVERRDFVSLDPVQDKLVTDIGLFNVRYAIKSGSETPTPESGFTITDATVALACAHVDIDLSTQAKREVGRLWVGAEPGAPDSQYRLLFNDALTAQRLWRAVQILRRVDARLATERTARDGRSNLVGVHGNRFIAHAVFAALDEVWSSQSEPAFADTLEQAERTTAGVYAAVVNLVDQHYEGNYLASLFKNATKCRELATLVSDTMARDDDGE